MIPKLIKVEKAKFILFKFKFNAYLLRKVIQNLKQISEGKVFWNNKKKNEEKSPFSNWNAVS